MSHPEAIRVGLLASMLAVRAGLRSWLGAPLPPGNASAYPIRIVYEGSSPENPENPANPIDVLVMLGSTESALRILRLGLGVNQAADRPALLLLSDDAHAVQAISSEGRERAWGVLPLDTPAEILLAAIQALHYGLVVSAPERMAPVGSEYGARTISHAAPEPGAVEALTERESQVLQLLANGLANKQIAAALKISENTVKFHVSSIYAKLGASSRTEAVRTGVQHGLIVL